jgi:HEPN domain-containing protein
LAREAGIPTRYPNGFERGAPVDFYTAKEADQAIANAEAVVEFCRRQIGG